MIQPSMDVLNADELLAERSVGGSLVLLGNKVGCCVE